ncbi:MAG: lactonase family protein [Tannerella sp.]|jgi:6-phosphogluconolactonase (cycloisomerase 2 family)|nr:lactonase family protein [Tannerella sp.]
MESELYLFVGTYAKESDAGIYLYRFNTEDGSATFVRDVTGIGNPSYLALDKDEKLLYSVSETGESGAKVYVYSFDGKTADIRLMDRKETGGSGPCFIWVDGKRKLAVTANYSGGSVSAFPLSATGELGAPSVFSYGGGTPGSARQDAPHLHCIYASPDEKYLYANDLGTDRIYKYELLPGESGGITLREGQPSFFSLPAGEGPRHTTFHPDGKFAYLIGELSGRVVVLEYDDGDLSPVQYIEADTLHAAGSADIHVTPDGRFLYASNRLKGDGLAIFSIDRENGRLTKAGYQPTGVHPRNFIITPDGKFLLCACRDTNVIQVFAIDKQSGLLKDIQKDINVSRPVCLKFASL